MGEQVHAVIVPREPVEPAALDAWCRERLAGMERPRSFEFVEELPRSEAGKLLRRTMREIADGGPGVVPSTVEDAGVVERLRPVLRAGRAD